jgi:hypothetical protein
MDRTFTHHKTGKPTKMNTAGLKANGPWQGNCSRRSMGAVFVEVERIIGW